MGLKYHVFTNSISVDRLDLHVGVHSKTIILYSCAGYVTCGSG